ncbi:hypothetical protein KA050_01290 [Candidatus Gracilibacteria bacterium]|nr:hypothetical protein [Candidatus Gracilibacteria bacterium]
MFLKRVISSITTVALCASFMVPAVTFADAAFTGGTDISGGLNVQVSITDLQVTGAAPGDTIPVFLYVPAGSLSMTTTTGLTFTGSSSGQRLYFSGTLTDINTALATLKYTHSSAGTYTLEASIIGSGQIYDPSTQHMYEVVNNGSSITATAARSAATARSINGVSGYLANITSSDENSFVAARITQDGWFGASDAGIEGDWVWLDGPESGTLFWRGTAGGTSFGYENWAGSEPNQSGDEDCSEFYANGSGWNDLPCSHAGISTYIVEYGAPGNLPNVASDTLDITLSADTTTQAPTLTSPTSNSTQNTLQLSYSLPEVPAASTVSVSFNDDTTTTTLTMSDSQSVNTTVNLASLISTSGVASTTAASLADGTYTVTLSYQDYLGNPASTDVATAVTIDTTALAPAVARPSNNETIQSTTSTAEGTCETGATVSISNAHLQTNPTTVVCSGGVFSTSITFLSSGLNTAIALSFTQTDVAGNVSSATVKNVAYALQTGGGGGGGGQPKDEEKKVPTVTVVPEQNILTSANDSTKVQEKTIEAVPLNSAEEKTSCEVHEYLKNPIRLGAKNNPEDVKLLEQFLNKYENAGLTVDGIYSREDFNAVMKWQEKYADDILKPWGLKKGTGYIYIKSLAKIKEIEEGSCD